MSNQGGSEGRDPARINRKDVGSWLEGPPQINQQEYPGQRLGRPESGPGSIARFPRRIGAIVIDWGIALIISAVFFNYDSMVTLLIFLVTQILFVGVTGHSVGHRAFGMQVQKMNGTASDLLSGTIRSVLLALFIPAFIIDGDQRGLHDRAVNTVLVRI
ncbi:RDD family protein [Neomicrococcus aestuarii]|nr:RDD family protein [Neomicrococcus aestuarii]APF39752.1 hypothetical protein BHE16_00510 [Neomicrococcus aestuarii]